MKWDLVVEKLQDRQKTLESVVNGYTNQPKSGDNVEEIRDTERDVVQPGQISTLVGKVSEKERIDEILSLFELEQNKKVRQNKSNKA